MDAEIKSMIIFEKRRGRRDKINILFLGSLW